MAEQQSNGDNPQQNEANTNKWQNFAEAQPASEPEEQKQPESSSELSYPELEAKLNEIEQKAKDNWDKFVRAQAEMDNLRRRAEKDLSNAHKYGQDKLSNSLLPIVDSLERAIEACQGNDANKVILEGIELTLKLFIDTLNKHGISQLNPKGELFDPNFHEAISMQETQEVDSGCVLNVIQKGYRLHDRVLRPALVIVAK